MSTLAIQGFSYEDRQGVLPLLTSAFAQCGGWVLDRKTTSVNTMEFIFEVQLHAVVELYGSLVATGVELTRATHDILTGLCNSRHHIDRWADRNRIVSLKLEVNFLADVTLHSLLMTGAGAA